MTKNSEGVKEILTRVDNVLHYAICMRQTSAIVLVGDLWDHVNAAKRKLEKVGFKVDKASDKSSIIISYVGRWL